MGDVGSRHQRESWALPWGAAWEFHVVPGAGGSQHKALDTSGVTFSSSRIHRSTGDPGRSRAGPRSRSSPEGSGTVGRPDLGQQPRPQPLSPASLTVGASGPVQGVPQAPGPADQPCALPATWTHPPMSWGTRSISQKEAAVRSRRDFLGHSANPADAPSTSPVEGVSTLPEVPQGRGAGAPPGQSDHLWPEEGGWAGEQSPRPRGTEGGPAPARLTGSSTEGAPAGPVAQDGSSPESCRRLGCAGDWSLALAGGSAHG